ncbi:MAG: D-alanyl-D-alanine carboxypeptidase/D-alanyl-D-alanine endopeptidase [Phycisphaerales bacterium]
MTHSATHSPAHTRTNASAGIRRVRSLLAPFTIAAAALLLTAHSAAADLTERLRTLIAESGLTGSNIGVLVMDADSGRILASHNPDTPLIPASNQKLLTSGAALITLGPDFVFRTDLVQQPEHNRLLVRASGDPAFGDPVLLEQMGIDVEHLLSLWVDAWKSASTSRPTEIVIDDRVFDREFVHPSWPVDQLNRWYCAEVAGLNFHTNVLAIYASPSTPGQPPEITLTPRARWMEIKNEARSVNAGDQTVWASRAHNTNRIRLHGDVRWNAQPVRVTINDVPLFFGQLLADRIARSPQEAQTIPIRRAAPDEQLENGRILHTVQSSMQTVLTRTNEDSQNLYAEALIKRIGKEITGLPGSWADGNAALRMVMIDQLGPASGNGFTIADGSGMSRDNRIAPQVLADWLRVLKAHPRCAAPFVESLPEPGAGTLERWFNARPMSNRLHAKTGTLRDVSALSGYVIDPATGRTLIVVTLVNDWPSKVSRAKVRQFQESVVLMADQWLVANQPADQKLGG